MLGIFWVCQTVRQTWSSLETTSFADFAATTRRKTGLVGATCCIVTCIPVALFSFLQSYQFWKAFWNCFKNLRLCFPCAHSMNGTDPELTSWDQHCLILSFTTWPFELQKWSTRATGEAASLCMGCTTGQHDLSSWAISKHTPTIDEHLSCMGRTCIWIGLDMVSFQHSYL